jgi:predicted RNA-binding protein associated with RNAse of E/G family
MACLAYEDWVLIDHEWDVSTLWLMEPGALHATWVSFLDNGAHWGWYINLQRPFERTSSGVTTMDLMLDVLIAADCREWQWKDEDEFQAMIDWGLIDKHEAGAVRAEAERVIARAEAGESPFSDPWPLWKPEPSWGIPELPAHATRG